MPPNVTVQLRLPASVVAILDKFWNVKKIEYGDTITQAVQELAVKEGIA